LKNGIRGYLARQLITGKAERTAPMQPKSSRSFVYPLTSPISSVLKALSKADEGAFDCNCVWLYGVAEGKRGCAVFEVHLVLILCFVAF
jgi:hypothetical protein